MAVETSIIHAPRDTNPNVTAPAIALAPLSVASIVGTASAYSERFGLRTRGAAPAFFDVTDIVEASVRRSGVEQGGVLVVSAHTTCAMIVQENEPLLLADLSERLKRFAHEDELYRHNDMDVRTINVCGLDECANGHSHCQHAILGASVSLPVLAGMIVLGRWQRILLVELDHPRQREFTVNVTGVVPR